MKQFRDIQEKKTHDTAYQEGFAEGLMLGCLWALLACGIYAIAG